MSCSNVWRAKSRWPAVELLDAVEIELFGALLRAVGLGVRSRVSEGSALAMAREITSEIKSEGTGRDERAAPRHTRIRAEAKTWKSS